MPINTLNLLVSLWEEGYLARFLLPLLSAGKAQAPGVWAFDTGAWHPASLRGCLAGWYGTSTLVLGAILGAFLGL